MRLSAKLVFSAALLALCQSGRHDANDANDVDLHDLWSNWWDSPGSESDWGNWWDSPGSESDYWANWWDSSGSNSDWYNGWDDYDWSGWYDYDWSGWYDYDYDWDAYYDYYADLGQRICSALATCETQECEDVANELMCGVDWWDSGSDYDWLGSEDDYDWNTWWDSGNEFDWYKMKGKMQKLNAATEKGQKNNGKRNAHSLMMKLFEASMTHPMTTNSVKTKNIKKQQMIHKIKKMLAKNKRMTKKKGNA